MTETALPQPQIYLIHEDQDRATADLIARHFTAEGMQAWCRGQRPPKGQGADQVLRKARAAVLLATRTATQSQLVHVDITRAARDRIPLVRLVLEEAAEDFETAYPVVLGTVTALGDIDVPTMSSLYELVRPALARRGLSLGWTKVAKSSDTTAAPLRANSRANPAPAGPDASALGLRLTVQRLAPVLLIGVAFIAGSAWWWMGREQQTAAIETKRRAAERVPLSTGMRDLTPGRLVEAAVTQNTGAKLPPGMSRAGYDAEPAVTDAEVADAATKLDVVNISRSEIRMVEGRRTCDIQVTIANNSDAPQPVVALAINLRDKSNLNLAERILKVERRWVPAGANRVIEGQLTDLPKWVQTIAVTVAATKS